MAPMKSPLTVRCPLTLPQARTVVAELMQENGDAIAEVFRRFQLQAMDADAKQEFFFRASKAATNWKLPPRKRKAWCCRVAQWVALDRLRQQGRRERRSDAYARSGMARREYDPAADREREASALKADAVQDAIPLLPIKEWEVIVMQMGGWTHREIAAGLGINERTVGSRLAKAYQHLKAILEPTYRTLFD
jgi:RNA polymerase sigma factor (sigma-70 family)